MALKAYTLPVCDVCGEAWFPEKGPARDDPRAYDQNQRAQGLPPLRCGKCKSFGWDRIYKGDKRRKNPHEYPMPPIGTAHHPLPKKKKSAPQRATKKRRGSVLEMRPRKRCNHGLLHCPQCHTNQQAAVR
jgi:hypothetical protein